MPELPEIETIRRALLPIERQLIDKIVVRESRLRWPIGNLSNVKSQQICSITRRGKYLLFNCQYGGFIIHLGMSGNLFLLNKYSSPQKHDHVDFVLQNQQILRYNDPRRFGCIIWDTDILNHKLLKNLGVEPLTKLFSGKYLYNLIQRKKMPIKTFLMTTKYIVGIGNIYASEILFKAKINPLRIAQTLSLYECNMLCNATKIILCKAIRAGGTTIRDFKNINNTPGYFYKKLQIYGKNNSFCKICGREITTYRMNGRSTFCCTGCQK